MIKRVIRAFAYRPTEPLVFKEGKCELFEEKKLCQIESLLKFNLVAVPATVFFALGPHSSGLVMNVFTASIPLICYLFIFMPAFSRGVKQMHLMEDGKSISIATILNKTKFQTVMIKDIKPLDTKVPLAEELFYKPILNESGEVFLISKASEFKHKDVVEKILEGEEIDVGNNESDKNE
jgi:hypothetical protein